MLPIPQAALRSDERPNVILDQLKSETSYPTPTDPEPWLPSKGDSIAGLLREVVVKRNSRGDFRVAHLDTGEGLRSVWLEHEQLWRMWRGRDPQPGDKVAILYHGLEHYQDRLALHMYSLLHLLAGGTAHRAETDIEDLIVEESDEE